jgi:uncharacterized protein YqgC (DUF456 family)
MLSNALLVILVFFLFSIATAGVFLPILPGVMLAWFALLIYSFMTDFAVMGMATIAWLFVLALLTVIIDFLAPVIGAQRFNASAYGIAGAAIGLLAGLIVLGPPGIIAGPFLGALIGEMLSGKHHGQAFKSAFGAVLGFLAGTLIKLIVILIMLGFFVMALI